MESEKMEGIRKRPRLSLLLDIRDVFAGVWTEDTDLQLMATRNVKWLHLNDPSHIDLIIQSGVVPRFVAFLKSNFTELQAAAASALGTIARENAKIVIDIGAVPLLVQLLTSPSDGVCEQALWALGNVASVCVDQIIQSGVVPHVVKFLPCNSRHLQSAAALALANIAAENAEIVIDSGAVPLLVQLLTSPSDGVREQVLWALGNVAPKCCDLVLEALIVFVSKLDEQTKCSMLRNAAWALSNFCVGAPHSINVLPALKRLIRSSDEQVLTDACWTLSQLFDGNIDTIEAVIRIGIVPRVVELLDHSSPFVLVSALRTVGNIAAGTDSQTKVIIIEQALPCLLNLLKNDYSKSIKKEACWTISNILAGNTESIQAVLDADIISWLVKMVIGSLTLKKAPGFATKGEAAWAISNATFHASAYQIQFLIAESCIMGLCRLLLHCPDPNIVGVCLEGFHNMLKFKEFEEMVFKEIESYQGSDMIMFFRATHYIPQIRKKAKELMELYWPKDLNAYFLEDDDEAMSSSGLTMSGKKRISPCPSPFPIESKQRLNPLVEMHRSIESGTYRILNAYLDETRPIKRKMKREETSLIKDVRVRYYRGTVVNDGSPTPYVVDLSKPKEDKIRIHLDQFCAPGETNSVIQDCLEKVDALEGGAYKDVMKELSKSLDLFKTRNLPACLDIYEFLLVSIDPKSYEKCKRPPMSRRLFEFLNPEDV